MSFMRLVVTPAGNAAHLNASASWAYERAVADGANPDKWLRDYAARQAHQRHGLGVFRWAMKKLGKTVKTNLPYIVGGLAGIGAYRFMLSRPLLGTALAAAGHYTKVLEPLEDIPILKHVRTGLLLGGAAGFGRAWILRRRAAMLGTVYGMTSLGKEGGGGW